MTEQNGSGYVVRMPRPAQLSKAMRRLGRAAFDEGADVDALVKTAIDAGKIEVEWSYVAFEDSMPTPRKIPGLVSYGQGYRDKDHVLTTKDKFDNPTWRAVRKGRRPTVFASAEVGVETAEEHLETATEFGVPLGNLKFFQVVPVAEWEATVQNDPKDQIAQRKASIDLARAKRVAEDAAAEVAALEARLNESRSAPNSSSDWHSSSEQRIQMRNRSDGSKVYRARVAGQTSPSFETLAEALTWRDQEAS